MLSPSPDSNPSSKTLNLTAYAKAGVLNDCPLPITKYPMEFNNQTLEQIVTSMIEPFNMDAEFSEASSNPFLKVVPKPQEEILHFLIRLADQKGFLITNNVSGDPLFWKTATGAPVASIKEGETPYLSCSPTFDPQKFFSHITGMTPTSEKKSGDKYTFENKYLTSKGILRPYTYLIRNAHEEYLTQDIKTAVLSKVGKMFAEACSYQLKLTGHLDKNGNIWSKNTIITVLAPGAAIYQDTSFLIKTVTIDRNVDTGDTATLDLVLPGAYNGNIPAIFPWEEA